MDLVSVIIPYFRKKDTILISINSVLEQTYKNFEIIIVYDDQNKCDLNFINEIKNKDHRISVVQNEEKKGAGKSRNIGIGNSKGKFIAFLDADDTWQSSKLSKQIEFMKLNNCDVSHTSYSIVNKCRKVLSIRKARNFFDLKDLLKSCDIGTSTVMMKKNLINDDIKFASLTTKEDFVLWLKLLKQNTKIYGLNEILTSWTKSSSSLSSSTIQKVVDAFKVYNKYMNFNYIKSIYYLLCLCINFLKKK
ncbi:MAG: glycosyltransferase family 2 protein [Candidatus Pelagibacter sp.]